MVQSALYLDYVPGRCKTMGSSYGIVLFDKITGTLSDTGVVHVKVYSCYEAEKTSSCGVKVRLLSSKTNYSMADR